VSGSSDGCFHTAPGAARAGAKGGQRVGVAAGGEDEPAALVQLGHDVGVQERALAGAGIAGEEQDRFARVLDPLAHPLVSAVGAGELGAVADRVGREAEVGGVADLAAEQPLLHPLRAAALDPFEREAEGGDEERKADQDGIDDGGWVRLPQLREEVPTEAEHDRAHFEQGSERREKCRRSIEQPAGDAVPNRFDLLASSGGSLLRRPTASLTSFKGRPSLCHLPRAGARRSLGAA
jgi:hypothetical protein